MTIDELRNSAPEVSQLILDGFQGRSFPITSKDFHKITDLLHRGGSGHSDLALPSADLNKSISELEGRYLQAAPEVKERTSRHIERGTVGAAVKKANGYKCQICEALGSDPIGFKKPNGEPYVEAHHVMPVSKLQIGSLAASNIMTLCANHHRQMHYGGIEVEITDTNFHFEIDESPIVIPRTRES